MTLPYLLLDIDGVLIPFPAADGSTPPTHVRHTVLPTGRHPDDPVPIWLDPSQGPVLTDLVASGLVTPIWCTSWRKDATTIIGPLLGLPDFPTSTSPAPTSPPATPTATCGSATTSTPGSAEPPPSGSTTTSPCSTTTGPPNAPPAATPPSSYNLTRT